MHPSSIFYLGNSAHGHSRCTGALLAGTVFTTPDVDRRFGSKHIHSHADDMLVRLRTGHVFGEVCLGVADHSFSSIRATNSCIKASFIIHKVNPISKKGADFGVGILRHRDACEFTQRLRVLARAEGQALHCSCHLNHDG